jgi:hypothetical protein
MKLIRISFFVLALFAFGLNSCKKSSESTTKKTGSTVSLKYNGTAYSSSTITAAYSKGALQIIGTFGTTTSVYMAIISNVKVGSFDVSTGAGAATFTIGTSTSILGDAGTITITSFTSSTVAGTFTFSGSNLTGSGTGDITEGTFQTSYTTQ